MFVPPSCALRSSAAASRLTSSLKGVDAMKKRIGIGLLLVLPVLLLPVLPANTSQPPNPPMATAAQYAGSDACMTCHEDVYKKQFAGTPHSQTTKKNGNGCESCHGPGAEHVAAGGDKTKIVRFSELSRKEASQRCLVCHGEDTAQRHSGSSAHVSNDVGCIDCHSPHHAKEPQHLLAKKQPELCYACHAAARAEFARPYRHRVNEGGWSNAAIATTCTGPQRSGR
jgi:predicted CXXCH cytochrome family protein